ncbi:MAG: adenosine kinase [Rhodovibrionaceae bacterium]
MSSTRYDVVGIGNAIVDVLSHAEEAFLAAHDLNKGSMTLIDMARAESLYGDMGPAQEASGGSAANTLAGLAALGGGGAFLGKVRNDQLGGIFRHDLRASGVDYNTAPASEGDPTARCLIFVTPDAQRTMATYLGASIAFGPDDLDLETVRAGMVLYLEGYLWDSDPAREAFRLAAEAAREAGRKVALTLSDPFCVDRHRASFRELVDGHVDLLFANESEIVSLYETQDFDEALTQVRGRVEVAALTRSEKGSVILSGDAVETIEAVTVGPLTDTTGAGDLYAAGFLYGYTQGRSLADCGRLGAIAAGEAVSHMGPRPARDLKALVAEHMK